VGVLAVHTLLGRDLKLRYRTGSLFTLMCAARSPFLVLLTSCREGDRRNYRGRISRLQIYNVPLTLEQINNARDNCRPYEEV